METTIGYRIECRMIDQTPGYARKIWFLDRVISKADGSRSTSNICSGDRPYCMMRLLEARSADLTSGGRAEVA